ncbi:hypothetical protein AMECASPLE_033568 [Ameca splendens]|uniref:Uncharacterized protein n=1 Tax=Ameca splendens TaxID=208324 RepID=A0ABV0ZT13_9TELE
MHKLQLKCWSQMEAVAVGFSAPRQLYGVHLGLSQVSEKKASGLKKGIRLKSFRQFLHMMQIHHRHATLAEREVIDVTKKTVQAHQVALPFLCTFATVVSY